LNVATAPAAEVQVKIEALLKRRIETQPHVKTAGSCFKAVGETPAWKLIDAAGLRGYSVGDVAIAEKHANFLLNAGKATFDDTVTLVKNVKGLGYKEASHFLRNTGKKNLAIIDFHIIDLLERHRLIEKPKTISKARYLEIEDVLRKLGTKAGLNQSELDLYLWYMETGKVLK